MLIRYLGLVLDAPLALLMLLGAFAFSMVVGLSFHEFSHALAARALGDRTAQRAGRLTLNPRAHLDPVGSLMILLAGFGWARPTPVNVNNTRHPRQAMALVALAGPVSNLVIAGIGALPYRAGLVPFLHPFVSSASVERTAAIWSASPANLIGLFLGTVVLLNVLLAVFNFLPLAPLDGFKVVQGVLPRQWGRSFATLEAWGPGLLFAMIALPWLTSGALDPLSTMMNPLVGFFLGAFLGDGGGF